MHKTFETTGPVTVRADLAAGDVAVEATGGAGAEVDVEPQNEAAERLLERVRVELRGSELAIEVPPERHFFGRTAQFALRVRCPEASGLEVRTASADVRARGRLADIDVKTASGDVRAELVDGETNIITVSGDVELGQGTGPVDVNTTSGDVTIGHARSGLHANLVSGDVTARDVRGGAELSTISGDVNVGSAGPGQIRAKTISGDVTVGVARGLDVWMDVSTLSGDTRSDLEAVDGPPADRSSLVELTINTTSGDIAIRRAAR